MYMHEIFTNIVIFHINLFAFSHYIMKKFHIILCGGCNAEVANIRDAFRMPGHSRCATTFVNPYGYAHTTVTVTKLSDCVAYRIEGQATTQHTWFPG